MSERQKIKELEQKIRVLEEENRQLSERAENSLLLGLIAAAIQNVKSLPEIFDLALERIAILKSIPYCTCAKLDRDGLAPVATFSAFSEKPDDGYPIEMGAALMSALRSDNVLIHPAEDIHFSFDGNDFQPAAVALIPFSSQSIPRGVFLFAQANGTMQELSAKTPLLEQAVDMAVGRADNQYLLQAVRRANDALEDRIEQRTRALSEANLELKKQVAEREKSERALKLSNERFMTVLDGIDAQVFVADMQTCEILFMNEKMKRDYGADLVGRKCHQVLHGEALPCTACTNDRLVDANGKPTGVVAWESHNPMTGIYNMNYDRAIEWVDNRIVRLQIATDISYTKKIEAEKERYQQQLAQGQKMEALGTLAGGIAHDFNNLMMGVQGHVSLMLAERSAGDKERLLSIESYINNATELTSQLLGMAKQGKYNVVPVDPNKLVRKNLDLFGRTKKEITIHLDLGEGIWSIEVDQAQIEQVLLNICVNAWQAMPGGGKLHVRTENKTLDDTAARARQITPGRYVKLTFTDTGVGIEPSVQEQIFDPFFTTKEKLRGTGLGLASAYGIVINHSGALEVDSLPGQGAAFMIYLPASTRQPDRGAQQSVAMIRGSGLVLLVDDEEMIRDVGMSMLEEIGYEVMVAEDGQSAIQAYRQHRDRIGVVILDLVMPGMGGGAVFDALKQADPDVRVLLCSGYSVEGEAGKILARGCDGFIQKPFSIIELSHMLASLLKD